MKVVVSIALLVCAPLAAHDDEPPALARTAVTHGAAGPFAVAGYRMGVAALRELGLTRGSGALEVVHYSPAQVQWICIVDGLQASTGASLGKLNLKWVETSDESTYSVVRDRRTGRAVRLKLAAEFVGQHLDLPADRLENAGRRVADADEAALFEIAPE